jgi:hypothetical protein
MTEVKLQCAYRRHVGGVDSSLAPLLVQGHDVVGIMLKLWSEEKPVRWPGPARIANRCCKRQRSPAACDQPASFLPGQPGHSSSAWS